MKHTASLLASMVFAVAPAHAQDSGHAILENPEPPVLDRPGQQHAEAGIVLAPRYPGAGSYRLWPLPDVQLH